MRRTRERVLILVAVLLASALPVLSLSARPTSADPWIVENADGTADAVWNFTNPADYLLTNTVIAGNAVSLRGLVTSWNSTTAADFAGPDSETNIERSMWPGDVAMAATSGPSTPLIIQPGAVGEDAWLDRGNPTLNYGADPTMILDGRNPQGRAVLRFDLSTVPAGVVIDNATLSLYQSAGIGSSFVATVYAITAAWDESQVTWDDRLTGTPWGSAGGDYNPHAIDQRTLDNTPSWRTWNVTQLVDLWHRGSLPNYGLILHTPNFGGADSDKTFYTSDYSVDPSLRPRLDISYRVLGGTAEYISKVGGPGSAAAWQTISWNATTRSLVTDEFEGSALDPKWTWTNLPMSYDVGMTTPGHLHVVSSTGSDLDGGVSTANILADGVVGNFTATMKFTSDPTLDGQKAGLLVLLNSRDWYAVEKTFVGATTSVNWRVRANADGGTAIRADVVSGNPQPAWVRVQRAGTTFTASTSPDGIVWTVRDTYTPAFAYPLGLKIAFFAADGLSGTSHVVDVDYIQVTFEPDATLTVQTRTGDTNPVDGTWSGWSAPYPSPSGSPMAGSSRYIEFRLAMAVMNPDHTPDVADVNLSWANYIAPGSVETADFAPADVSEWGDFAVVETLNGQTIAYQYSTDSGGTWTPVAPPASLQAVSTASGKIRFRATLSTTDTIITPTLNEMRLTYRHNLDHFAVTASAAAIAGASFVVTVTAEDALNNTIADWTGTVVLEARLSDGTTPGGGILGITSLAITTGGTATLNTETYTKAETIRIQASFGTSTGLSGNVVVSPGALDHIDVTPSDVTLLPFDSQIFTATGFDLWNNSISGLTFSWTVVGGVGTLNSSSGVSVNFTASPPAANGTVHASFGGIEGISQIHVASGARPTIAITTPVVGAHLSGVVTIRYTNSSGATTVTFEYDAGSGWVLIGIPALIDGVYAWDTSGLDFAAGSLRATVQNAALLTNTSVVGPIEVDNTPPTIALGPVTDDQATSGTLTLAYTAAADVVRVDFSYFDGAWNVIGTDSTIDGMYVWTPGTAINGVTLRAVVVDDVDLSGSDQMAGVGTRVRGPDPPILTSIPPIYVHVGSAYVLNLTFYVTDADTPRSALMIWSSDAANVTAFAGWYPSLSITYAAAGTYVITLWISDGTDTAWALLTINAIATNPPMLVQSLPEVVFDEDTTATNGLGTFLSAFFVDLDGDSLTFAVLGASSTFSRVNGDGTVDFWSLANWYGSETLRIRATDPGGGFAESAFLVTVRSVNDLPIIAPLPSVIVDGGSPYTLDLAPYLSDVETAVEQLTVTTDSPHVTATGLVLTLTFPPDWTQASFTVTVSDGIGSTSQAVQVSIIPPPPTWLQSWYLLGGAAAGGFVVVAMFAQRARWRPAKAFLVDERGQLLREFTLDASCQVTYDQVFQAGALDAVEKPVKVSKYHAQTVRGDALAVILLAYGPVTLDQVEFAREMLVNIQDKFDEGVKQRLEDARAYEAELDAVRERLEASRNAFAVQSRTFAGMVDAITTAQTKMAAESLEIRARVLDLKRREALLKEDRRAIDDVARQIEEQRAAIDSRAAELRELESDYTTRIEVLQSRESQIGPAEVALAKRESALQEREAALRTKTEELAEREKEIQASLRSVEERMAAVGSDRAALEQAREKFEAEQRELLQFRESIEARVGAVQKLEADSAERKQALDEREAHIAPIELDLSTRTSALEGREIALRAQAEALSARERELEASLKKLAEEESAVKSDRAQLDEARTRFEVQQQEQQKLKSAFETRAANLQKAEQAAEELRAALEEREARLVPIESDLKTRDALLRQAEDRVRLAAERAAAERLEASHLKKSLEEGEVALARDRALFEDARRALGDQGKEFEARIARFEEEARARKSTLDEQAKVLEAAQLKFAQEKDGFEAMRSEKSRWIASKEIELESREQALGDKETAVRAQAEENARKLADLAAREEALEIEGDKIDKARAEIETRKADLERQAKSLETRASQLRDEEARKAEEYRTWQATLESEESLLKEQKETFEKETGALRESWGGRMLRLQIREEELGQREEKVRADVEWVARNDEDLKRREKAVEDSLKATNAARAEIEAARKDLAQHEFELQTRERALREEAAKHADELATRDRVLTAAEAELAEKRAQFDREMTARTLQVQQAESELSRKGQEVDAKAAELAGKEARLSSLEAALQQEGQRVARERTDLQALGQQLDARQVELAQARQRNAEESTRLRADAETFRQSVATKEADLRSERERMERDSTALQEKLGAKAQELAAREKALAAREAELHAEEADAEARVREIDSWERQTRAHAAELEAQAAALAKRQQDLDGRAAHLEQTANKLALEEAEKRREWENLRTTLEYQEKQIAATAEERSAEAARRVAELEAREKALTAAMAQIELERARLADAAKAQAAKDAEAAAAWSRSEKRFLELKNMETDLLKARQAFESERSAWSNRRSEELKQLEMTRDAAAEQGQQAERLIAEAQRRALLAAEAEKAAARQGEEIVALQRQLEARRAEAERAENAVEARTTQLNELVRKIATDESAIAERAKTLDAREAKLSALAAETSRIGDELKAKRSELDLEAARLTNLAADIEARRADAEARMASAESKKAEMLQHERVLTTELQRAENLMEDLNRKEVEVKAREKSIAAFEAEIAKREKDLASKDADLRDGMQSLAKMRQDLEAKMAKIDADMAATASAKEEAEGLKAEAEKARAQAEEMQKEVSKNMKFLQKKAVDVLDREESVREREMKIDEDEKSIVARVEILEQKEKALEAEREEMLSKIDRMKAETEKLRTRLSDAEKAAKPAMDMEDWKKDIENRVKIIQKKAMELLDREETLRKKEEELRVLARQLGVQA